MIHIWRHWKLSSFQDTPHALSMYVQNSSTLLTLDVQFQTNPPFLSDNQSVKRKHNPKMTIKCYQVGFRFQYQLINFIWLSFDFFSFRRSLTICFFVAFSCVCSCPKQTIEQQQQRACEQTKSKQKQNQVVSRSNWPRVIVFDLPHKQCNGIIKGWFHCLTSASKGRFLNNNILMYGSRWCLLMVQIQFSVKVL